MNMCGRGDKDIFQSLTNLGLKYKYNDNRIEKTFEKLKADGTRH